MLARRVFLTDLLCVRLYILLGGLGCALTMSWMSPAFAEETSNEDDDGKIPDYIAPPLTRLSAGQVSQPSSQGVLQQGQAMRMQGGASTTPIQRGHVIQTLPEGARPAEMDISSLRSQNLGMPNAEPELAPVYMPQTYPSDPRFINQTIPNPSKGTPTPNGQEYWQGVYWPYKYKPYEQGSYWPYKSWPYENDAPWQGSNFPYVQGARQQRDYGTLSPSAGPTGAPSQTGPLNEDERAELEMWRRLSAQPIEVTISGKDAFIRWAGSGSEIPIPKDGKIQIKLSPAK